MNLITEFKSNRADNLQDFINCEFVRNEYGIIEMFEYLMAWDNEMARQLYEDFGADTTGKSIGAIISKLFLIKGDEFFPKDEDYELDNRTEEDLKSEIVYESKFFQTNKEIVNRLDISFIEAIASSHSERAKNMIVNIPRSNKTYYYDNGSLNEMKEAKTSPYNSFYVFDDEKEVEFFEDNILTLDPKLVIRIVRAFSLETQTVFRGENLPNFKFYNAYDENSKKMVVSPYHLVYHIYKDCRPLFNIFIYTDILNVEYVSKLYNFNFDPENSIVEDLGKMCTFKLRSNYIYLAPKKYLENPSMNIENALYKFMFYNAFVEYVLYSLVVVNDKLFFNKQPKYKREYSLCDCIPDAKRYEDAVNRVKLEDVFDLHLNSKEGDLFVYDFDNTLGIQFGALLKDKIIPEKSRPYSYYDGEKMYAPNGIEKLSQASKFNKPIILTKRHYGNTNDIREYLKKFDINAYIVPMLLYNGREFTKPEVIYKIWNYIGEDIGQPGIKIKSINFADDLEENFEDINIVLDGKKLKDIKTHLVSLENEFIREYLM